MKNYIKICFVLVATLMFSCQNGEWEFDDFEFTSVYFPHQYPIRTLVLGDYKYDNSRDNEYKFFISARMGGVYQNESTRQVSYEVQSELVENILFENGDTVAVMPNSYYSFSGDDGMFGIESGSFTGAIEVTLTDAFFQDPNAIKNNYVIPVRITDSSLDSILVGATEVVDPNRLRAEDWTIASPKDFTLFGVKYVNPYHGKYIHRGITTVYDVNDNPIDTIIYSTEYVEQNEIWELDTRTLTAVETTNAVKSDAGSPGNFSMLMEFSEIGAVTISSEDGAAFPVTGSGNYVENGDSWGNKERDVLFVEYEIQVGTNRYVATDTITFRDKGVAFETFSPTIYQP